MGKLIRTLQLAAILLFVSAGLILVAVSLPFTGWRALSVQTGSMEPAIPPGSLVFVHRVSPDSLKKGDVITYKSDANPNTTITHRVTDRRGLPDGPKQTIVKGDANAASDAPVYDNQIVGKVAASVPYAGKALDWIKTPWGMAIAVYLPAVLIFISEIRLLVRRLTELEIKKRESQRPRRVLTPIAAGVGPVVTPSPPPAAVVEPAVRRKTPKRPLIGSLSIMLAVALSGLLLAPTLAELNTTATLSNNTISSTSEPIPPEEEVTLLLHRVDFPEKNSRRSEGPKPIEITVHSTEHMMNTDLNGWTLESSAGVLFELEDADKPDSLGDPQGHEVTVKLDESLNLNTAGDFLVLKDPSGNIIDAISWGTNTTHLNPSIQGVNVETRLKRLGHNQDTNTATDWEVR